jgi:hypothetical protein
MKAAILAATMWVFPVLAAEKAEDQSAVATPSDGTPVAVVVAAPGTSQERALSPVQQSQCDPIARPLIRPVVTELRHEGSGRLASISVADLSDAEAARFIGAHLGNRAHLASTLMEDFLRVMRARKSRAEVERQGSWSLADEQELTSMTARVAAGIPATYKAYLVKAGTGANNQPVLFGALCGTELHISAGLLGEPAPTTIWPAVVFLPRRPTSVVATVQYAR